MTNRKCVLPQRSLGPRLRAFKVWRLRHQMPALWRGQV